SWGEILPRGSRGRFILEEPEAVLGVAGGFVVIGRIAEILVAAHYDLFRRHCRILRFEPTVPRMACTCFYFREYHTVVAQGSERAWALDLSMDESPSGLPLPSFR